MSTTPAYIKQQFIYLLDQKPLRDITVKELCHQCNINRNTFYYHFNDIPDLIEQITTEEVNTIIAAHSRLDSFEECLRAALDFAVENRRLIMHIYNSANRSVFERHLWKICHLTVSQYIHTITRDHPLPPEELEFSIEFFKCTCFGFVIDWINQGMPEDAKHRIIHFSRAVKAQSPLLNI